MTEDERRRRVEERRHLDEVIKQYTDGQKDAYESATKLQDHTDNMFIWIMTLMAGGLVATYPMLKSASIAARWSAVTPWLLGILVALIGRILARGLRTNESLWHFDKTVRLRLLLLKELDAAIRELQTIVDREEEEPRRRHAWLAKRGKVVEACFHASQVLFVVGMIAIVAIATIADNLVREGGL
jgi:hypothetical protein